MIQKKTVLTPLVCRAVSALVFGDNYKIVSADSGKVLDVIGGYTTNGTHIQQWDWLAGLNQQWQIVPQGSSLNTIVNLNSGKVLEVQNFSQSNGAATQQYTWLSGLNQQWQVVPVQNSYHVSGHTKIYYKSTNNQLFISATTDQDYYSNYYYGNEITTWLYDNGSLLRTAYGDTPRTRRALVPWCLGITRVPVTIMRLNRHSI